MTKKNNKEIAGALHAMDDDLGARLDSCAGCDILIGPGQRLRVDRDGRRFHVRCYQPAPDGLGSLLPGDQLHGAG